MNRLLLQILFLLAFNPMLAQSLTLAMPEVSGAPGTTVNLELSAADFNDVISLQFSINWDETIIEYASYEMQNLDDAAIGETEVSDGMLRFSWFDISGDGIDLVDEEVILTLEFLIIGNPGESSIVEITGTPLDIQVYQNIDGNYEPTTLIGNTGAVLITEPVSVNATIQLANVNCFGGNDGFIDLSLTGNTNSYSILWTGPNGFNAENEDLDNLEAGEYQLNVFDENNDLLLDTSFTIVEPLSALAIDELELASSNCGEADGSATISIVGGTPPYQYDIGQGATGQPVLANLLPGAYTLSITDANQCGLTGTFTIDSTPLPEPDLGSDIDLCEGDLALLEAGDFADYQWSTGEFSASITVEAAGTYEVTVTNDFGCSATDLVTVSLEELVAIEIENDVLETCPGESLQLLISGGDQFQWIDSSGAILNLTIPNPVVAPLYTSTYWATTSNSCGSDTVALEVFVPQHTGKAMNDTCVYLGTVLQLHVKGGKEYRWEENEYPLNAYNIYNPKTEPLDSTFYVVEITDNNDCVIKDTVFVAVAINPSSFIPAINTLTPNGDGENDFLDFQAINKFGPNRLTVFNRWGDIIYEKVNYQSDGDRFDATHKGKELPGGTYYYVLSFTGGEEIKQTLLIVR